MAYFAEVKNGIVQRVIVADAAFIQSGKMGDPSLWVETTEQNYAGKGDTYDAQTREFMAKKPFASWVKDPLKPIWKAPVDPPVLKAGEIASWNEVQQTWEVTKVG